VRIIELEVYEEVTYRQTFQVDDDFDADDTDAIEGLWCDEGSTDEVYAVAERTINLISDKRVRRAL
jgi:hypothetical protein